MYYNEKHIETVENRKYIYIGSYNRKEITMDNKNQRKNKVYIRIKCPYCKKEYDIDIYSFNNGVNCKYCCNKYENSFAYHIEQELGEDLNKYWDWKKNELNPYHISKYSHKKVWIKCAKVDYHESYETVCSSFTRGDRCPYCNSFASHKIHPKDSFAQWCIDNIDPNFIEKYWSNKNTIDPFSIAPKSNKKVWIKCQEKDYHEDYLITCEKFIRGERCPYCSKKGKLLHFKDSFGSLYPEKAKYWSSKNKKSPYEVAPRSGLKYWFICENCGEEFEITLDNLIGSNRSIKCVNCTSSKGEQKIDKYLKENNIKFIPQKEFEGLVGLGNGNLSYDFYLPDYNLLIEYQGEQHEYFVSAFHNNIYDFKKQQEHDKRKSNYAKQHNINFLEIWYYDYDNIENILQQTLYNKL